VCHEREVRAVQLGTDRLFRMLRPPILSTRFSIKANAAARAAAPDGCVCQVNPSPQLFTLASRLNPMWVGMSRANCSSCPGVDAIIAEPGLPCFMATAGLSLAA
jgi:hypothetical protein